MAFVKSEQHPKAGEQKHLCLLQEREPGVLCTVESFSLIVTNSTSKQDNISVRTKDSVKQHSATMPEELC